MSAFTSSIFGALKNTQKHGCSPQNTDEDMEPKELKWFIHSYKALSGGAAETWGKISCFQISCLDPGGETS